MYEIVVISGKGGTGKTTVCSAFAHLMENGIVCDLDVDAPDLHIIAEPQVQEQEAFISGQEACISQEACIGCGTCMELCQFGAIHEHEGRFVVDPLRCEGCGVCEALCPVNRGAATANKADACAITMTDKHCGDWYVSESRFGPMVHAQLFPGEENSGRLVSLLKLKAKGIAKAQGYDVILCDGSPGIGCPVISSLAGARLAVAVVEPTPSGRHDFSRVADLCDHFRIAVNVIINKASLNDIECQAIRDFCAERGYDIVAELPFCHDVYEAMISRKALTELESPAAQAVRHAWEKLMAKAESDKQSRQRRPQGAPLLKTL